MPLCEKIYKDVNKSNPHLKKYIGTYLNPGVKYISSEGFGECITVKSAT